MIQLIHNPKHVPGPENIDTVDTLPMDVESLPTPPSVPAKPASFDDSDTRRQKFQGLPKVGATTKVLGDPSDGLDDSALLGEASKELGNNEVLRVKQPQKPWLSFPMMIQGVGDNNKFNLKSMPSVQSLRHL